MNTVEVIYEDEDVLVVDKPSGVTVNRADTTKDEITLQDFSESHLAEIFKNKTQNQELDFYKRAGIVHRLDKETSGLLIIAKNEESFENLQLQFKERRVEKIYVALVHGFVNPEAGEISAPVGRLPWNRKRFGVLAGGKEASTEYQVIEKFQKPFTLLELKPKTGRTHQIRVHLKYFNHPIFGDPLYGGRKVSRDDRKILERVFLHAHKISFFHPKNGKKIELVAPLPTELKNLLESLKH